MEQEWGRSVVVHRDPNHYAKGLVKNVQHLCEEYPVLEPVAAKLKAHFLIGTFPLATHVPLALTYVFCTGVKLHAQNEEGFCSHMRSFIPHITEESHSGCMHRPRPNKTPLIDPVEHAPALKKLKVGVVCGAVRGAVHGAVCGVVRGAVCVAVRGAVRGVVRGAVRGVAWCSARCGGRD